MLRLAFFICVLSGGSKILENLALLDSDSAWLLCGIIGSVLMFLIPGPGRRRDPKDLILYLVCVLGSFAVLIKMRPWLAVMIGAAPAAIVSIIVFLVFAGMLVLIAVRPGNSSTTATP